MIRQSPTSIGLPLASLKTDLSRDRFPLLFSVYPVKVKCREGCCSSFIPKITTPPRVLRKEQMESRILSHAPPEEGTGLISSQSVSSDSYAPSRTQRSSLFKIGDKSSTLLV